MRLLLLFVTVLALAACDGRSGGTLEGRPGGPYRMSLTMAPAHPQPEEETELRFALTYRSNGRPVTDLQIAHERLVHNFITDLEFSSFAHIHHEDFAPLTAAERDSATVAFPYRFPHAGHYRIVSEFVHRDRSYTKHFDVVVGDPPPASAPPADLSLTRTVGDYTATLTLSPARPVAGFETALDLDLARGAVPVTDLELYLGTELHGAVWREDGRYFGHLHSYTPKVAAIMALGYDQNVPPEQRGLRVAEMITQLMCVEAELVFKGPTVPMRYVFPEAGRYHLFLQVAPGGTPHAFHFVLDIGAVDAATAEVAR